MESRRAMVDRYIFSIITDTVLMYDYQLKISAYLTFLVLQTSRTTGLSQTFQDSFAATRRFGLDCVWIDSLCTIQNHEDDWRHESSLMAQFTVVKVLILQLHQQWTAEPDCVLVATYCLSKSAEFKYMVVIVPKSLEHFTTTLLVWLQLVRRARICNNVFWEGIALGIQKRVFFCETYQIMMSKDHVYL